MKIQGKKHKIIRIVGNNLGGGARINVYMANEVLASIENTKCKTFIPKPRFKDKYTCENLVPFDYSNTLNFVKIIMEILRSKDKIFLFLHLRNVSIIWGFFSIVFGIDYVIFVHAPNLTAKNLRENILRKLYKFVLERASCIVFVSDYVRNSISDDLLLTNEKQVVIPNASDTVQANVKKADDVISIVLVGELTPRKEINDFIELIKLIGNNKLFKDRMIFHVYGTGELAEQINSLCMKYSIVEYHGYEVNTSRIYDGKDFLIMLSRNEAFGRVVTEGASVGIVPILRNAGAFQEFGRNLQGTILFNDLDDLVEKLGKILQLDQAVRDEMKCVVSSSYVRFYSKSVFKENLEAFYRRLMCM